MSQTREEMETAGTDNSFERLCCEGEQKEDIGLPLGMKRDQEDFVRFEG